MNTNADVGSAARRPLHALFEPVALLLLSLATVGTAWCSYQAATWGGVAQGRMNLSAATSRQAAVAKIESLQYTMADVLLFSQYINARATTNEPLARFYAERFRGEAKSAFEAWLGTKPFENPAAPLHPFVTNLYQPQLMIVAREKEAEAGELWREGAESGRTGRAYVLVTVLLATALFCAGTASKFERPAIRRSVLALGVVGLLFAISRLLMLPVMF
jgi:hypothetical protein